MFRWFETRIEPFPAESPVRPPETLLAFYIHFIRPIWPAFTMLLVAGFAGDLTQGSDSAFAVAVDARRDMIYFGLFDGDGQRREGPLLLSPQDAVGLLPGDLRIVGGSGATLLAEAAKAHGHTIEPRALDLQPNAAALAELALLAHETVPVLRPLYLRPPDAKPQAQMTARR